MQEKRIVGKYSRLRKGRDQSQKKTDAGYVQGLANWVLWLDRSYLWQRSEIVKRCRYRLLLNIHTAGRGEICLVKKDKLFCTTKKM